MKKNHIATALLMFVSLAGAPRLIAQTDQVKEQLTVPLSDPNKPGKLHVGLINGSIHVVGYAGKEVVIDAVAELNTNSNKRKEPKPDELANGMKRISTRGDFDISAEEKNNNIHVSSNSIRRTVNLTIKVPQQFSLKVSTVNHGEISIENVTGEFEVNNVNGPIQLTNIAGSAVANTVNGLLKANFKSVNSDAPMAFSTLNGNVDVTFPATAKFNVKLKSDRGEIYSDFDVDVDKTQPKATRSSQEGMYKVSIDDWVQGKVNGGGREVMMKNMNGNIYIRKAK
ncbi:DUF4097 family beta strand repeat-containing protein [Larkinella rosea]|uniref:DUF4097 domain-containing protein n=1 Tax=Larkinella rosea TaxID=2025312 RepID=A0A3P1BPL9_9BACT|nr:DUF4097 family beta strand repeat-containing protein [Larkinella rosea]RRB02454.1 hypothetical protein EHT25_18525 [Larkinella rosea]